MSGIDIREYAMTEKIHLVYVTDWNLYTPGESVQDPFFEILKSLDARFSVRSDLPRHFAEIDLLVLHPRLMKPEVFETISLSKSQNPDIKTIVISGTHGSDLFLKAIDVGVDKYLLKPLSPGAVQKVAQRLIQQSLEAKAARKAFRHVNLMFGAISKTSFTARMDETGHIIDTNDLLLNFLGYSAEQMRGIHWFRFVERRFWLFLRSLVRERLRAGEIYRGVIELHDVQGVPVMVDTTLYAVLDEKGEIDEIVFIGDDVTEMHRAILASMERLIDYDTSLAVLFNHRREAIMVNRKFLELGGYENTAQFFSTCGLWNWMREENEVLAPVLSEKTSQKESLESIFESIGKIEGRIVLVGLDGEKYYFTVHTTSMPDPMIRSEEYHILYFVDVTDFERVKEEKLSDAKLMSVGRLAAAITHEINTPITYIKGNLELLKLECEGKVEQMESIFDPIEEGIGRIESIVGSMYEFAGTGKEEMRECNVHMTLVYALRIVQNRAKHIVPITINGEVFSNETTYNASSCLTMGISTRLEQVWIIILNNALDEFEKGTIPYEKRHLDIRFECGRKEIVIRISDNAGGIPEAMLKSIFDFAIGGEKKKSMGIGLNVAKAIIDKHGGSIRVGNENHGAVFEIALKILEEKR